MPMLEAIAADMLEAMKDSVWRSISSRVKEYAIRFGSMDKIIGPIAFTICAGAARVRIRIGKSCSRSSGIGI